MITNPQTSEVDPDWYLWRYGDVASSGMNPLEHYRLYGHAERRFPNAAAEAAHHSALQIDPIWYFARYSDAAASGLDPVAHYIQFGAREGRHRNAESERRQNLIDAFDSVWYLARNSDVAASGMPPLQHFIMYGLAEGRSPCEAQEARGFWKNWFDPVWYEARYPETRQSGLPPLEHYLKIGIYEGRAPTSASEDRSQWTSIFDADWYATRYTDVAAFNIPPLEHFITYGIIAHRRPNATVQLDHAPVEAARLAKIKQAPLSADVALFVTHAPGATLKPHLRAHLEAFRAAGISIVLIIATETASIQISRAIGDLADIIYIRQNQGFDFAAWAHVIRDRPDVLDSRVVYLLNDSTFGPFGADAFDRLREAIEAQDADIVGLTDNYQLGWHLQSYFLVLKRSALASEAVRDFFVSVVAYHHKNDVINEYETQFASMMIAAGLRCSAVFKAKEHLNYTALRWRELIERGFPYLKVTILSRLVARLDISGWRERLIEHGYETAAADETLAEIAASLSPSNVFEKGLEPWTQRDLIVRLHYFFAGNSNLSLNCSDQPVLSIVISTRNQAEYLYGMLLLFSFNQISKISEIVIIDRHSNDDTRYLLSRIDHAKIAHVAEDVSSEEVHRVGLAIARGDYILMMHQPKFVSDRLFVKIRAILDSGNSQPTVTARRYEASGESRNARGFQSLRDSWDVLVEEMPERPQELGDYIWLRSRKCVRDWLDLNDRQDGSLSGTCLQEMQTENRWDNMASDDEIMLVIT